MKARNYKFLVFSWNTQSVPLCESPNNATAENNRNNGGFFGFNLSMWKPEYVVPDFFPHLKEKICEENPDIVVIGFQEDRHPGSYFHSHYLPSEMPEIGYSLLKRTKLMGIGKTSYDNMFSGDLMRRGIRVSIYCKKELLAMIENAETELRAAQSNDGQDEYVLNSMLRNKGATVSYLCLPGYGRFAFICCHLPFNSQNLVEEKFHGQNMIRQTELNSCNEKFNLVYENFVLQRPSPPTYVIYFGDMNYRVSSDLGATRIGQTMDDVETDYKELYTEYDELKEQMTRGNIYEFSEGIDNEGPCFAPTYKLDKNRKWKTGKYDQRNPSWCDRILYKKTGQDGHDIVCTYYDRFDYGLAMSRSDHAAVMAVFEVK